MDSYSDDATLEIIRQHPQVQLFQRPFDSHAKQWNYGIAQVDTDWALSLDADYIVTPELRDELAGLAPPSELNSYWLRFRYCVFGQPLRGAILPPRQALFRVDQAEYIDDGHTQLLQCGGDSQTLKVHLFHDDRKSLQRWLWAQDRYAKLEVQKLLEAPRKELSFGDRIRRDTPFAPLIIVVYCLLLKGGILEGPKGLYYAAQRCVAELILALRLLDARAKYRGIDLTHPPKGSLSLAPEL